MRILFLLSSDIWSNTLPKGFKKLNHEVQILNSFQNEIITTTLFTFKPDFCVTIGWGWPQRIGNQILIRNILKKAKIPHIYWSTEDPAFTHSFSIPLIQRMNPEFVFSICSSTVEYMKKLGIKSSYMDFGYEPEIHKPTIPDKNYSASIAIVANAYPNILKKYPEHYRHTSIKTLITPLLENNIRIDFWGNSWDEMNNYLNFSIPTDWIHGYLPYEHANKVYSSSKIVLGLQNYINQLTQRTYEILASGGFLLTSNTPAISKAFQNKKHLISSSSPEETLNLVNYYLGKPNERNEICNSSKEFLNEYTYENRAQYMIDTLTQNNIL